MRVKAEAVDGDNKKRTQRRLEGFLGKTNDVTNQELHFQVPFLPLDAPQEPTPSCFNAETPLYAHQQRSLHRMLQIESRNDQYTKYNFGHLDYEARGGCLADAIGMGKTATILALICSAPRNHCVGGNLVVAPSHLLAQWHQEVRKFVRAGEIQVVVGLHNLSRLDSAEFSNRLLVLVSVDEVVASSSLYYESHELYAQLPGQDAVQKDMAYWGFVRSIKKKKLVNVQVYIPVQNLDVETREKFVEAGQFVHKAYRGSVWTSCLHFPKVPWHRVVFEEVQDLVSPGKRSQDCFIQLTRSASHVWLVTATPFPEKAQSIYANNQLLGFKRLRLAPQDAAFDDIKRKLYLRNCAQVHEQVIANQIEIHEAYFSVALHPKETWFYRVELAFALANVDDSNDDHEQVAYDVDGTTTNGSVIPMDDDDEEEEEDEEDEDQNQVVQAPDQQAGCQRAMGSDMDYWSDKFQSCRQCCVHVGLSDRLVQRHAKKAGIKKITPQTRWDIKSPHELFSDEVEFLRRQLATRVRLIQEWKSIEEATSNTVGIVQALLHNVYWTLENCFSDLDASGLAPFFDATDAETKPGFRVLVKHVHKWGPDHQIAPLDCLIYSQDEIEDYLRKHWDSTELLRKFGSIMAANARDARRKLRRLRVEQQHLETCMTWYRDHQQEMVAADAVEEDAKAAASDGFTTTRANKYTTERTSDPSSRSTSTGSQKLSHFGTKISRLITYLQAHPDIQVVVFTQWPMAMQLLGMALRLHGISNGIIQTGNHAFASSLSSEAKTRQVTEFQQGMTRVLILNAKTNASGINLMNASHVVFLEPVGDSASQASMLEQQAIGRVVRMGQQHQRVHVLRFVAEQTLEMQLYEAIHQQRKRQLQQEKQLFNGDFLQAATNGSSGDDDDNDDDDHDHDDHDNNEAELDLLRRKSYVCWQYEQETSREELPQEPLNMVTSSRKLVRASGDGEDEEIEFVGAMTLEEAIQTRVEKADIVDLTAAEDEENDNDECQEGLTTRRPATHEPPRAALATMASAYDIEAAASAALDRKTNLSAPEPVAPVVTKRPRDDDGDEAGDEAVTRRCSRSVVPRHQLANRAATNAAAKTRLEEALTTQAQQRQSPQEQLSAQVEAAQRADAAKLLQQELAAQAEKQRQLHQIEALRLQLAERAAAYEAAAKKLERELAAQAQQHQLAIHTAYAMEAAASAALDRKVPKFAIPSIADCDTGVLESTQRATALDDQAAATNAHSTA